LLARSSTIRRIEAPPAIGVLDRAVRSPETAGNLLFACERGLM
jgi:hypothetical protein